MSKPERRDNDFAGAAAAVIQAGLGVGASIAKAAAQATTSSRVVPPPTRAGALNAIIHYGVATVMNVAGMVTSAVADRGAGGADAAASVAGDARRQATQPRVRQGATLRIPLSIENPGAAPMSAAFRCTDVAAVNSGMEGGPTLGPDALRFDPTALDIQPRDFEKLTVYIETSDDTRPGKYRAVIAMGDDGVETVIDFEVVAADGVAVD